MLAARFRWRFKSPFGGARSLRVWLLAMCLGIAACGEPAFPKLIAQASKHLEAENASAGLVEVKRALQQRPESAEARILLVKLLAADGEVAAGSQELERAERFGATVEDLATSRGLLLAAQLRHRSVIQNARSAPVQTPRAKALLAMQEAQALLALGHADEARAAVLRAMGHDAAVPDAQLALGRAQLDVGDRAGALAVAETELRRSPESARALLLKGDVLIQQEGQREAALQAYREATRLRPRMVDAHGRLIAQLLEQKDLTGAQQQVNALAQALPGRPLVRLYQALVAFQSGDMRRVRELTQGLSEGALQAPQVLYITGVAEARLGNPVQAEGLLARAVRGQPQIPEAFLELAALQLRLGKPRDATQTLRPYLKARPDDSRGLVVQARAQALDGDLSGAEVLLRKVIARDSGDSAARLALAELLLRRGDAAGGVRMLEQLAAQDAQAPTALLALLDVHVRRRDKAAAFKTLEALQTRPLEGVTTGLLLARTHRSFGDSDQAIAAYESELKARPADESVLNELSAYELGLGRVEQVKQRLQALIKRNPRSVQGLFAMADVLRREGASRSVALDWVDKAMQVDPRDARVWRAGLQFVRDSGDLPRWLARAQDANAAVPADTVVLRLLADALAANGQTQQAVSAITKVVDAEPDNVDALVRRAGLLAEAQGATEGLKELDRALAIKPDHLPALRLGLRLAPMAKPPHPPVEWLSAHLKTLADTPAADPLRAEAAQLAGDWAGAARQWQKVMELSPSSQVAVQLHRSLTAAGKQAEAERLERERGAGKSEDMAFVNYLADETMRQGQWARAEGYLKRAVQAQPDAPGLVNNLALVTLKLGRAEEAQGLAERAVKAAPWSASFRDTLAHVVAARGRHERAAAIQAQAVDLSPQVAAFRLRLASYQLAARQRDKAESTLDSLRSQAEKDEALREAVDELRLQLRR